MKTNFRNALVLAVAMLLSVMVEAQPKQTASVEGITEYVLDNGLKVLLFPDQSSQTITVNITYKVGSRHEGYGERRHHGHSPQAGRRLPALLRRSFRDDHRRRDSGVRGGRR